MQEYTKQPGESVGHTANNMVEQAYTSGEPVEVPWGNDKLAVEVSKDAKTAIITVQYTVSFDESVEVVQTLLETATDNALAEAITEEKLSMIIRTGLILHEIFCPFNNNSKCGWYYEDWNNPESLYHWYLQKAKALADTNIEQKRLNLRDIKPVSDALRQIDWEKWPTNILSKAERLLSLVGNDKEKALTIIQDRIAYIAESTHE